jgi:hypothetical protein
MVVVDGSGVPVGAQLASAQISEHRLAESTLATVKVPRTGSGRPRSRLRRVVADRGYDSDPLRERLKQRGTDLIVPKDNIRVDCPLCGEKRRFRPNEVFLGEPSTVLGMQNKKDCERMTILIFRMWPTPMEVPHRRA